jgi:replicative DNA helicase
MIEGVTDRLPPNESLMERAIIGCILQKPEIADECASRFKAGGEVFFDLKNRQAYLKLLAMRRAGEPIDITTALRAIGDLSFLSECENAAASAANFEYYADKVSEAFMLRKTMAACVEASASVYDNQESADAIISGIETKLATIRDLRGSVEIVGSKHAKNLLMDHLETRFNLEGRRSGIETGLHQFDAITDGLQYGELSIIGARPSQGKTALATTVVHHACIERGLPTLFVTLEMSIAALCRRILSRHCRMGMRELKTGSFKQADFGRFSTYGNQLAAAPLFFVDSIGGTDSARVCSIIKRAVKASGVKLVVIDYLQKIHASGKHEKRTYEVGEVSTSLKAVAVETGAALLVLAQLSREPEKQKGRMPQISDLADSAQIERDADLIGLLHRDKVENEGRDAKLIIAKQRDGELGVVELNFEGMYASFENRKIDQNT